MWEYSWQIVTFLLAFLLSAGAILHILFRMRGEPERALFWCVVVFFLPGPGVVLYLLAGVNRYDTLGKRVLLRHKEFFLGKTGAEKERLKTFAAALAAFCQPGNGGMPGKTLEAALSAGEKERYSGKNEILFRETPLRLSGNDITFYHDGRVCYSAMLDAISEAKHSIHLQSFIFAHDPIGRLIMRELRNRAAAGVKVVVICDHFGSFGAFFSNFFLKYIKATPNLRVIPFSRATLFAPWRIQLRNHRKLLIVDGRTAFVGGLNICEGNYRRKREKESRIRDFHCRLAGPSVGALQYSFLCDYFYAAGKKIRKKEDFFDPAYFPLPEKCGTETVRVIPGGHGFHFEATEKVFLTACATAEKSITVITPYFVPSRAFLSALQMAGFRGVKVTLILPSIIDHALLRYAAGSCYEELLRAGVRIYERQEVFLHAKAMLVDSSWCYFGSSNCDCRSFHLNFELDILVEKGAFTAALEEQLEKEIEASREILPEQWQKRSPVRKLLENAASLAAPLL